MFLNFGGASIYYVSTFSDIFGHYWTFWDFLGTFSGYFGRISGHFVWNSLDPFLTLFGPFGTFLDPVGHFLTLFDAFGHFLDTSLSPQPPKSDLRNIWMYLSAANCTFHRLVRQLLRGFVR